MLRVKNCRLKNIFKGHLFWFSCTSKNMLASTWFFYLPKPVQPHFLRIPELDDICAHGWDNFFHLDKKVKVQVYPPSVNGPLLHRSGMIRLYAVQSVSASVKSSSVSTHVIIVTVPTWQTLSAPRNRPEVCAISSGLVSSTTTSRHTSSTHVTLCINGVLSSIVTFRTS